MRRKYFGLAIAAFATLGPMQAWGGDREIAEQIIKRLKTSRDSGALQDFTLDMKVDNGVVLFRGNVSVEAQRELLLEATDGIEGISHVVDEVSVNSETAKVLKPKAPLAVTTGAATEDFSEQAPLKQVALAAGNEAAKAESSFREALAAEAMSIRVPASQRHPAIRFFVHRMEKTRAYRCLCLM